MFRFLFLAIFAIAWGHGVESHADSSAANFKKVPNGELLKNGIGREYCDNCGMHLRAHYKTNTAPKGVIKEQKLCANIEKKVFKPCMFGG